MTSDQYRQHAARPGLWAAFSVAAAAALTSSGSAQTSLLIENPFPDVGDFFGVHVASVGADKVLIGAPGDSAAAPNSGAAYLFDLTGNLLQTYTSPDPMEDEHFGRWLIGVGAKMVLISAIQDEELLKGGATMPGMSYLFDLDGNLLQTFANPNPSIGDTFGVSAALDPQTLVIGANSDDTDGLNVGKVFQFEIGVNDPVQDFSDPTPMPNHMMGWPIAAVGSTMFIVGAEGAGELHIFDIVRGLVSTIDSPDPTFFAAESVDSFGPNKVLVGSESFEVDGQDGAGGVFIFEVQTGDLLLTVPNPEPQNDDAFGIAVVSLGLDAFVVGADRDNPGGINNAGTIYLYDANGFLRETIDNPTPQPRDQFGRALAAIDSGTIVVGAPQGEDQLATGPGEAYVFFGLAEDIDFDPPEEFEAFGEPTVQTVGDLGGDETTDIVVAIPGDDPKLPGHVQVFLNQGIDDFDEWLGLTANKAIPVGIEPSGVAVDLFNADEFLDLAVANAGDDNVLVFFNTGAGDGTFEPPVAVSVGGKPSDVVAADFTNDGFIDLAVVNALDNNIWILVNDGAGVFAKGAMAATGGVQPIGICPEDLDNDKDVDVVGVNRNPGAGAFGNQLGSVFILINNGRGGFEKAVVHDIGVDPTDLSAGDLDGDDFTEIVAVNNADATVSVLVNQGDGTFVAAPELIVGDGPLSIDAVDLDADGDLDLAVVAEDIKLGQSIQVLQNLGIDIGDLSFAEPIPFSVEADPNFVVGTDLNEDFIIDLITVNADEEGKTGGSVTALINVQCPWDLDDSGGVGTGDLITLLGAWGTDPGGPPDFDGNGIVGTGDLILLLGNWGLCP